MAIDVDLALENLRQLQGRLPEEAQILGAKVIGPPLPTSSPGVNTTQQLPLDIGPDGFHKPIAGGNTATAAGFGHASIEATAVNELAAWRLATELGPPFNQLLRPCVLYDYHGEGPMTTRAPGWPRQLGPLSEERLCRPAALFDSLIAHQDRHGGNWRWDGSALTLLDQGYAFARPGDHLNAAEFVAARHGQGWAQLEQTEVDLLQRLLDSPSLLGMALLLPEDQCVAFVNRAELMLQRGEILTQGEW
jgi:hypothetical protein